MGKRGKQLAKERRERRLEEISHLRQIPYTCRQRWWTPETVAVVTGSSRGIGYEIARQLAVHGVHVVITSTDEARGKEVVRKMCAEGMLNINCCQLDVADEASVEEFANWVVQKYGGVDILVNNAGVNYNMGSDNSVQFAEKVIRTNYIGTKKMIKTMIPLMKPSVHGARILNVSSRLGRLNGRRNRLGDRSLREQLSAIDSLSEELIDSMVSKFLEQVGNGSWTTNEWPQMFTDYSISKLAVNAYTRLMAGVLSDRPEGQKIHFNCYCPGWVRTSMTGWAGNMSAEEGADTGVWAVLLPSDPPLTGKFFAERREISFRKTPFTANMLKALDTKHMNR